MTKAELIEKSMQNLDCLPKQKQKLLSTRPSQLLLKAFLPVNPLL